jgi:hypothetical protein
MPDQQQAAAWVSRWPFDESMAKFVRHRRLRSRSAEWALGRSQSEAAGRHRACERVYSDYMIRRMGQYGGDGW